MIILWRIEILFDHIINNIFGSPPSKMLSQVRSILENDNDMRVHYSDIEVRFFSLTNKVSDLEKTLLI